MTSHGNNHGRHVTFSKDSNIQHGPSKGDDQKAKEEHYLAHIKHELRFEGVEQPKEQVIKTEVYHSGSKSHHHGDVDTEAGDFISRMRQKMAMERLNTIKA